MPENEVKFSTDIKSFPNSNTNIEDPLLDFLDFLPHKGSLKSLEDIFEAIGRGEISIAILSIDHPDLSQFNEATYLLASSDKTISVTSESSFNAAKITIRPVDFTFVSGDDETESGSRRQEKKPALEFSVVKIKVNDDSSIETTELPYPKISITYQLDVTKPDLTDVFHVHISEPDGLSTITINDNENKDEITQVHKIRSYAANIIYNSQKSVSETEKKVELTEDIAKDFLKTPLNPDLSPDKKQAARDKINKELKSLTNRERDVLRLRFGVDDGKIRTQLEVAKELGISRGRVRQLEMVGLAKIRHKLLTKQRLENN